MVRIITCFVLSMIGTLAVGGCVNAIYAERHPDTGMVITCVVVLVLTLTNVWNAGKSIEQLVEKDHETWKRKLDEKYGPMK